MIHKILVANAMSFTWDKELSLEALEMANILPFSNMLMEYPLECFGDVVAFLPFLAMIDQCCNPRRFQ